MSKNLAIKVVNKNIFLFLFFVIYAGWSFGQNDFSVSTNKSAKVFANEIIERAKNSISKGVAVESVKSISLKFDATNVRNLKNGENRQFESETEISVIFPDQIKIEVYSDFTTNQQLLTEILNFPQYSQTIDTLVDGKPFYFGNNLSSIAPKSTKESRIAFLKRQIFRNIFPIILQSSWYQNLEFEFIGEAESKDGKVNVIEASDKDNTKLRLFFDKQDNLLVMMSENFMNEITKEMVERKSYYSDYREENGLLVAHKIIVQTGDIITEQRQIEKLQINPIFKSNLFEIKKDKVNPFEN